MRTITKRNRDELKRIWARSSRRKPDPLCQRCGEPVRKYERERIGAAVWHEQCVRDELVARALAMKGGDGNAA